MSSNVLYTDLSNYYDLMCADINYREQSEYVRRVHQLFGNGGKHYLDLACGTGPHVKHFINFGYQASGLDINQPMLDFAQARCPEAQFIQHDMSNFDVTHFKKPEQFDLISCFLYSIHYNQSINKLKECVASTHDALKPGGVFCFNAVDKNTIDNKKGIKHTLEHNNCHFAFQSNWHYSGHGDRQALHLSIEKTSTEKTESWQDQHQMVAISFQHLRELLQPYFAVHIFEHAFDRIVPWDGSSGNAIFVAVKT
ncbi:MAG: class I SAM-dependent methyltransferase [Pseudomonadota bacterium]